MKSIRPYFQEIGIILSYTYLLIASYLFDWKPFSIFFSSLAEVFVLFVIYCVVRVMDKNQNTSKYRKSQPLFNSIIGIIPLLGVQALFVEITSTSLSHDKDIMHENMFFSKEAIYAIVATLIIYVLKAIKIKSHEERVDQFQVNFIFKAITITCTSILAMVIITNFGVATLFPVFLAVVVLRIFLEFYFGRKMKLI